MILLPPWPGQSAAGVEPHPSDHRDRHVTSPVHLPAFTIEESAETGYAAANSERQPREDGRWRCRCG
jgi:hypothetical protein